MHVTKGHGHIVTYLTTIRLRARDFYEVIAYVGEARISYQFYHLVEIESESQHRNR